MLRPLLPCFIVSVELDRRSLTAHPFASSPPRNLTCSMTTLVMFIEGFLILLAIGLPLVVVGAVLLLPLIILAVCAGVCCGKRRPVNATAAGGAAAVGTPSAAAQPGVPTQSLATPPSVTATQGAQNGQPASARPVSLPSSASGSNRGIGPPPGISAAPNLRAQNVSQMATAAVAAPVRHS